MRFDYIDGSYDDSKKPKPKNPQRPSTGFLKDMLYVKARMNQLKQPIQVRRTTACEQSTISHEQTYGLLRLNLLSLTVGFDRIDAAMKKTMNQTLKVHRSIHD